MRIFFFLLFFFITMHIAFTQQKKVLLITGGHDFEETPFFEMFDALNNITYEHVAQPTANTLYKSPSIDQYDVLIFYDMWNEISTDQKKAFLALTKKGKGMIFLHHSLVSYQEWDDFKQLVGGKYYEKENEYHAASTYQHDVFVDVVLADGMHPVTAGLEDFRIFDEVYGHFEVLESVHPLLTTNHPESTNIIGWANTYNKSRIVYLQPGHGRQTFNDKNYRQLLINAINWVAEN